MNKFTALHCARIGCAALLTTSVSVAVAQPAGPPAPGSLDTAESVDEELSDEVIVIEEEAPYIPVASKSVRDRDFLLRPRPRPADMLRVVPGMFVNQHAGGGKANQYFLRGFDADHGTDVAFSFDGVPVNMVSHAHGQGYTDLNWVIPELVQRLDIFKGPYSAKDGDFATAGSINMVSHTALSENESYISQTAGRFNTWRSLAMLRPPEVAGVQSLLAGEVQTSDGPFDNGEDSQRYSVFGKASHQLGATGTLSLAATSYAGRWNGSGQIPERAVESGMLSRFGSVDPSEGGTSSRHSVYGQYSANPTERSQVDALAYLVKYDLSLFSNFTFFAADPLLGDQINQVDDRWQGGARLRYRTRSDLGSVRFTTSAGLDARGDRADTALHRAQERSRLSTAVDARIMEGTVGLWAQEDIRWTRWLRTVVGSRVDLIGVDVVDRIDPSQSGTRSDIAVSPKASVVLSPTKTTDLYANFGFGFHSNDARSLTRTESRGTPLTQALGYELGARTKLGSRVDLAGSLWLLDLDSEVVWVGDEGTNEARGSTRRLGAELEARAMLLPWLHADLDVTWSRARFRDLPSGENLVPLAPEFTVSGGVSARHESGLFGRFGVRALSDRPLTEDGFLTADGFALLDLSLGYRHDRFEILASADNLLNTKWREAQFATASRLATDPSTDTTAGMSQCPAGSRVSASDDGNFAGCEDEHFTPGSPLNVMVAAKLYF